MAPDTEEETYPDEVIVIGVKVRDLGEVKKNSDRGSFDQSRRLGPVRFGNGSHIWQGLPPSATFAL